MIRLIASDIDGTLLQRGERQLSERLLRLIAQLEAQGIRFVPASGRPYASLRALFDRQGAPQSYLCENGALLMDREECFSLTELPREDGLQMAREITAYGGLQVLVSGTSARFILDGNLDWLKRVGYFVGREVAVLEQIEQIAEPILKVTAWCPMGVTDQIRQTFEARWADRYSVAVAGDNWLDITLADKGKGLREMARHLKVAKDEIMVFGDNFNDLPMFRAAGFSYAMEQSAPEVKAAADGVCSRVEDILEEFLSEKGIGFTEK